MQYDVFLSHNHADKAWARRLFETLGRRDYNGRNLRPWLDERVLDPGELSSPRELFSALDRSRCLLVVVSAASLGSSWVAREIAYFLGRRTLDDVLLARLDDAQLPDRIAAARSVGCGEADYEARLFDFLCPRADEQATLEHRRAVRRAAAEAAIEFANGRDDGGIGRWLDRLLTPDIADAADEGIALAGFDRAGQHLCELDLPGDQAHWTASATHAMCLVLGEILALAVLRHPRYAQVAADYIRKDLEAAGNTRFLTFRNRALRGQHTPPSTTNLLLAAARSAEKLSEVDPHLVDLSLLGGLLERLDSRQATPPVRVVAMMIGRALARLRAEPVTALLLHALLLRSGPASRLAVEAAAGIGTAGGEDGPLSYTPEMSERVAAAGARHPPPDSPYLASIRALLAEGAPTREAVCALAPDFGASPQPVALQNGPLVGRTVRVTLDNMEALADRLGPRDIAVLTEARIVDALFDRVGGFLVRADQVDAPLGRRLSMRRARFAGYDRHVLEQFADGTTLALWSADSADSTGNLRGVKAP